MSDYYLFFSVRSHFNWPSPTTRSEFELCKRKTIEKRENNLPGFEEASDSSIRYNVAIHAAGCEAIARLEEGKRRIVDRREMVRESGQKSGEKIEKERRLGGTGEGDLNTKLSHQMRHHSEVIEFIFTFSLETRIYSEYIYKYVADAAICFYCGQCFFAYQCSRICLWGSLEKCDSVPSNVKCVRTQLAEVGCRRRRSQCDLCHFRL